VHERVGVGNTMYTELVKLAEAGKRIWFEVNDSLYNDYILYPNQSSSTPPAEQQVFESEVTSLSVVNLSVTDLDGSETLSASNTGTVPLRIYFSALPTDLAAPDVPALLPRDSGSGTAAQSGYLAGVREYLNVYNPSTQIQQETLALP
jgi:hypothetical protein